MEDKISLINNYDLMRFYLEKISQHTKSTLEILHNEAYSVETTYKMSAVFLSSLENAYLRFLEHQYRTEMFGDVFESIYKPYNDYIFELKEAINEKEDNLTWLQSRHDALVEVVTEIIETINIQIKELQNHS